eukprot:g6881.t1
MFDFVGLEFSVRSRSIPSCGQLYTTRLPHRSWPLLSLLLSLILPLLCLYRAGQRTNFLSIDSTPNVPANNYMKKG